MLKAVEKFMDKVGDKIINVLRIPVCVVQESCPNCSKVHEKPLRPFDDDPLVCECTYVSHAHERQVVGVPGAEV